MDLETAQTNNTAKLPILKHGEYEMWKLKIDQYNQVQDYALWDVIENENSFKLVAQTTTNAEGTSTTLIPGLETTEEKYKDAKTLFAAIQIRFSGNNATKKTQKTLLKQMYENFSALSTESLDSIFNILQKIVSQLAIIALMISTTISRLLNKRLKELQTQAQAQVLRTWLLCSSPSSTNEVNTAYGVSTTNTQVSPASTQVSTASTQVSTANLSNDTVYAFLASQPNGSQLVYKDLEQIHEDDIEEMDLKWQLALLSIRTIRGPRNQDNRNRNQDNSRRTINVKEISSKAMLTIDGAGFDWSYMADDEVPTNMALMAFSDYEISVLKSELENLKQEKESNQLKIENFDNASMSLDILIGSQIPDKSRKGLRFVSYNVVSPPPTGLFSPPNLDLSYSGLEEFQQPQFEGYGPKPSKSVSEDTSNEVKESPDALLVEELVSDDKLEKKTVFATVAKIEFVRAKQQEKPVRKPVKYAEMYRSQSPRGNQRNWNNQKSQQLGSDFVMYNKACFVCGSFDHVQSNCNYHQRERVVSGNNYTRVNYNYSTKKAHPSAHKNMAPRAVLMKIGLRPLNTARPVNTAHPKTTVYSARPMPKAVNTARPNSTVVNAVRANQVNAVKALACWVWRPTKLNNASITLKKHNYVDARGRSKSVMAWTSRNLMEDMLPLGEEPKEAKLLMCDKKNSILFTDTACFVLSLDFKLADESQVLLKVPRKNNMYSVDMKNIVPKESLTCLAAKATLDESMLWHRRLGHVNFKTINKLVKDNSHRHFDT
ncbi:putative ribonuclease H-like domain-containing protein [Tanacetum coccineum]